MKLTVTYCLIALVLLSACAKNEKKIMVLNRGTAKIDIESKTVTIKDGAGSEENEMLYNTVEKITIKVIKDGKETTANVDENGYYILNTKKDTIVGSFLKFSEQKELSDTFLFTQDVIKKSIDSLIALTEGKNISAANRNFFIPPNTAVKITGNVNATIIAPFHNMRSIEKEGDKEPEVYRFFTNTEMREKIAKQVLLTKPKMPEPMGNGGKKS